MVPGIGNVLTKRLMSYCGSAQEVFKTNKSKLGKIPGIAEKLATWLGNSLRDISDHIREMYDTDISTLVLSEITNRSFLIIPEVDAWKNRLLEPVYCVVWFDAMHFKVREEGKVVHKPLYNILGIAKEGKQEILAYSSHKVTVPISGSRY